MKNYFYVQFYNMIDGYYHQACGSDAIFKLDGRLTSTNMRVKAISRAKQLYDVKKYNGFSIEQKVNGRFKTSDMIHEKIIRLY